MHLVPDPLSLPPLRLRLRLAVAPTQRLHPGPVAVLHPLALQQFFPFALSPLARPILCADHTLVALSHRNIPHLTRRQVDHESSLLIPCSQLDRKSFPAITVPLNLTYSCQSPHFGEFLPTSAPTNL